MKPLLVYDGDCGFCRHWIARWRHFTQDHIEYAPYQQVAERFPNIPKCDFETSVRLIEPDGRTFGGAEAVFRALAHSPGKGWPLRAYQGVPGVAAASEAVYAFVAAHRPFFSRLTRILWGRMEQPASYHWTRWVFLRLLGIVYLIAFLSLADQVLGLMGREGILPAERYLEAVRSHYGGARFDLVPTLFWIWPNDAFLRFLCWGGSGLSALLIIGVAPATVLLPLWVFYLSLVSVGGDFLSFQWDNLLLETGFLAILFAPGGWRPKPGREHAPSRWVLFLLRWLLFRLMFSSGIVKLMSGDSTWRDLTALHFHYETQPLPTWTSWLAHQIPSGFQKFSVFSMFVVEMGAPFLVFLPRRPRLLAFLAFSSLQILICATGNYTFFNLLSFALAVLLLDDARLDRFVPRRWKENFQKGTSAAASLRPSLMNRMVLIAASMAILVLSGSLVWSLFERPRRIPASIRSLYGITAPFRSINGYGLFAVMTTQRDEIIIEGSDDQESWKEYEFKWKPGDVHHRPDFVQPHQPRLDWQMWFAALSTYDREPWFANFMFRLLQGSPEVLELLGKNPFPDRPPAFVRATLYRYRFTTPDDHHRTGDWWHREYMGTYSPVLSLR
ncbi:MAG: lipase maturation factor family protein [Nitrospirae bacterium]|nr:lipase maturation factor family protein [Nitrospirota bacterium]